MKFKVEDCPGIDATRKKVTLHIAHRKYDLGDLNHAEREDLCNILRDAIRRLKAAPGEMHKNEPKTFKEPDNAKA